MKKIIIRRQGFTYILKDKTTHYERATQLKQKSELKLFNLAILKQKSQYILYKRIAFLITSNLQNY